MTGALWTGAPAPLPYVKLLLCREYHCTPPMLKKVALRDILDTLTILRVEGEVAEARSR